MHELLNAQGTVMCSYFAQRAGTKYDGCGQKSKVEETSKDWRDLNENWWKAVGKNMDRKTVGGKRKASKLT